MNLRTRLERLERVIAPSLPPTLTEAELAAIDLDRRAWWASMVDGLALGSSLWGHHGIPAVKQFIGSLALRVKLTGEELQRLAVAVDARRVDLEKETPCPVQTQDTGLEDTRFWPEPDDAEERNGEGA